LTVLVHYRSLAVFSLGMWSSLLPTGFRVSGGTHVHYPVTQSLRLRVFHPLRTAFPIPFASPLLPRVRPGRRTRNHVQPPCSSGSCLIRCNGFGLLPVRSPLLRESSLFLGVR